MFSPLVLPLPTPTVKSSLIRTYSRLFSYIFWICKGLTDAMCEDYMVMRELVFHMRLNPGKRQQELHKFMGTVQK